MGSHLHKNTMIVEDKFEDFDQKHEKWVDKVHLEISDIKIEFYFENLGDLISHLSKSNVAKILGTFLVDI